MGYIRHNAIIVTGWNEKEMQEAKMLLEKNTDLSASDIVESGINGYKSFMIAPDGSKEGWEASDKGDSDRELYIQYLGRTGLDYVEISYGGDEPEYSKIVARNGYDYDKDESLGYRYSE